MIATHLRNPHFAHALLAASLLLIPCRAVAQPDSPQPPADPTPATPPAEPDTPAEPAAAGEEVIYVTGSYIPRNNLTGVGHVTVVTADDLALSGIATVDEFLQELPSVTLQGINKNQSERGNGLSLIDLRNLGVARTLVLVNGRRFVRSGTGLSEAVDLNNIPVAMIERVEVLLDGATAIYGADAIGGVVNIVLKQNFDGSQFDIDGGISGRFDGEFTRLSQTAGKNFKRGNITVNVSYLRRGEIAQSDRDWARDPVVHAGYNGAGGVEEFVGSSATPDGRVGDAVFVPDGSGASFQDFSPEHRYNFAERQSLVGFQQRLSTTLLGHYRVFSDADFYVEGTYTNRFNRTRLAPQALGLSGTATFPGSFQIPVDNPYIPEDFRTGLAPGTESVLLARRLTEVGDRITDVESDTFRVVTGLRGRLLERYRWDAYVNYGRSQANRTTLNSVDFARVLETVDPELCARNAARGCVLGNYFGRDSLTQSTVDYIRYTDVEVTGFDQFILGGTIGGDVIKEAPLTSNATDCTAPDGSNTCATRRLGVAAGYWYRDEDGMSRPSAVTASGDSAGSARQPLVGGYNIHEVYGEVHGELKKLPGAHDLNLQLAGRLSSYEKFGSKLIYRGALGYAPIPDVRLRSSFTTSFQAPAISSLFGGSADVLQPLDDPCHHWDTNTAIDPVVRDNCQAAGVPTGYDQFLAGGERIRTNIGGNPNLGTESGRVFTAGFVFWPTFVDNLAVTADYYNIAIDQAIAHGDPQSILDSCYRSAGLSSTACAAVERGIYGGIDRLDAFARNIDRITTSGLDLVVNYSFDLEKVRLPDIGRVALGWQGNVLLDYSEHRSDDDTAEVDDFTGTIARNRGTYTRLRWVQRTAFSRNRWSASSTLRYIGGADLFGVAPGSRPYDDVEAALYWDLAARYKRDKLSVILGIDNILDRDPPFFLDGSRNANGRSYDFVGRYVFTRVSYRF